ncbi:MAG: TrkA C-terminal domain-containing protein [Christensenellaceae bacterium]|jgi:hypothetical protein
MGLVESIILFAVVLAIYVLIIDIFSVFFRVTGVPAEKARFQVISLLTNSGYTTKESEIVVEVLPRRKLARKIMLFGYIFSVTIVAFFINMMMALPAAEFGEVWPQVIAVCAVLAAFLAVKQIPGVKAGFNRAVQKRAYKWLRKSENENPVVLLDEYQNGVVAYVIINALPKSMEQATASSLHIAMEHNVHIMLIKRDNELLSGNFTDVVLQPGDALTVFGKRRQIESLFSAK